MHFFRGIVLFRENVNFFLLLRFSLLRQIRKAHEEIFQTKKKK